MTRAQIIEGLRVILNSRDLSQDETDALCAAIRALGGNP